MRTPQHTRTAGQAAAARGWSLPHRARWRPAREARALTTLRAVTYVLASVTCLMILVVLTAVLVQGGPSL